MLGEKTLIPGETAPCPEHTRRKARSNFPLLCASDENPAEINMRRKNYEDISRKRQNIPLRKRKPPLRKQITPLPRKSTPSPKQNIETRNQHKQLLDAAVSLVIDNKKKMDSPFRKYIGEILEQVASPQREIAEKLFSDVLFLARTNRLNFESKIQVNHSEDHHNHVPHLNIPPHYLQPQLSPEVVHQSPNSNDHSLAPHVHYRYNHAARVMQQASSPEVSPSINHNQTQPVHSLPSFDSTPITTHQPLDYSQSFDTCRVIYHHTQATQTPTPAQTNTPLVTYPCHIPITCPIHHTRSPLTPTQTPIPNTSQSVHLWEKKLNTYLTHHNQPSPTRDYQRVSFSYSTQHFTFFPTPTQTPAPQASLTLHHSRIMPSSKPVFEPPTIPAQMQFPQTSPSLSLYLPQTTPSSRPAFKSTSIPTFHMFQAKPTKIPGYFQTSTRRSPDGPPYFRPLQYTTTSPREIIRFPIHSKHKSFLPILSTYSSFYSLVSDPLKTRIPYVHVPESKLFEATTESSDEDDDVEEKPNVLDDMIVYSDPVHEVFKKLSIA
ncbi:flocculation protein FLO11-like isoform X6 [Leguminivora glycinivorella]|nr:flocculation protein FLO11-like isoform X6 [Leguminivora glycinivorella]